MSWGSLASTRRRFLLGSVAVGATATSAPALLTGCTPAPQQARAPSAPDWAALARDLQGRLLRPNDPDYRSFAQPYNLAYDTPDRMPQGIALCAGPADVGTSLKWAQANGIALRGRSGGHSYGGFSTTPDFMIDVSTMKSITWDSATKRVTAASGARNGDLYKVLRAENRMMTHGRCPTVGVAGFLLGGGIGFNMRLLGVASDDLAATEIVTADGRIRRLPEGPRDDLFWACRGGGGGNFGLNTSFTLNTHPAGSITVFNVNWQGTRTQIEAVVPLLMQDLDGAPEGFGSRFSLAAPSRGVNSFSINLIGQFHGPRRTVDQVLSRAIRTRAPSSATIEEMSYWDGQDFLVDSDPPFRFHERSAFLPRSLNAAEFHTAFDWLGKWPGGLARRLGVGEVTLGADLRFFQTGERMNDKAPGESAFVHRSSRWLLDIGIAWMQSTAPDVYRKWQDGFYEAMRPYSNGEAYQNFIDPALTDWQQAYYASNLGRLSQVKRAVDPGEVFKFPQSIPPAPQG